VEGVQSVMYAAVADLAVDTDPGAGGDGNAAQIGVRGLEPPAVIDAHRLHARYGAGERHYPGAGGVDPAATQHSVVNPPVPGVGARRRKLADDGTTDGRDQGGAWAHGAQ
jgi:hypothetical protein